MDGKSGLLPLYTDARRRNAPKADVFSRPDYRSSIYEPAQAKGANVAGLSNIFYQYGIQPALAGQKTCNLVELSTSVPVQLKTNNLNN